MQDNQLPPLPAATTPSPPAAADTPPAAHADFLILGAGAAGMMAAAACGELLNKRRHPPIRIVVLEKNPRPGIKVLVCGGGRCNVTNAGDLDYLIAQFGRNGRFLTPALQALDNNALRTWLAGHGVPTHEEHDGKIYPDSNKASSVVNAFLDAMAEAGVEVHSGADHAAADVTHDAADGKFVVRTSGGAVWRAGVLLICVGGQSYTRMGTTGDGYRFAAALGHDLVTPRPAIVPLLCKQAWISELQGLAVPDVEVRIESPGPLPRLATGKPAPSINDLLFTHFGLSGPAVLNLSEIVAELLEKFPDLTLRIDFARHSPRDELSARIRRWHDTDGRKLARTMLAEIVPQRLADMICRLSGIDDAGICSQLSAGQAHAIVEHLKACRVTVYATRGFKEAMVTAGGVKLDQVNPKNMESRICPGLLLAGEVLDLTGPSGGYNLQLAFSTGYLAGITASRLIRNPAAPGMV